MKWGVNGNFRIKFKCPECGKMISSRVLDGERDYNSYKRYRQCEECKIVFITKEKVDRITGWRSWNRKESADERQASGESSSETK